MKIVKEVKGCFRSKNYEIYIDKKLIHTVSITIISKKYKEFQYVFLLDSDGKVIDDVFEFLNDYCKNEQVTAREQTASALKVLYSFCEVILKKIKEFNLTDVNNLSKFILGQSIEGNVESHILTTSRDISTHDQYFDNIRKFLNYINIDNEVFFGKIKVTATDNSEKSKDVEKYLTNLGKSKAGYMQVPSYISLNEYHKIIKQIEKGNNRYKLRNILIVNLMYILGLRLGEVLGITLEDIKAHPNNSEAGIICLRNRVSDRKDQHAKTCMKVFSRDDYGTKRYKSEKKGGYQSITIPTLLMKQIKEYINESRELIDDVIDKLPKERIDTLINNIKADCVEENTRENYYLFLGKNFTPLTQGGWSKALKQIFLGVGITTDKGVREENLSHRFRHGFAMFLLEVIEKDIFYIKRKMRHKSIQSTLIYLKPTQESILQDTEMIINSVCKKYDISREEKLNPGELLDESENIIKSIEIHKS
ncbi:tyrosine-type recombinase/integrase [Clostridium magnum]|uniref:Tyrosine recombinase XerC n=1 Tax=Clostridium magnum DSM 2767 TaxID=1121326 RepID=A0A162R4U2_9CLOT|nr:site-specific integrase [Clostridium magnum]KZL89423.1 tyrosine recombinase XerC [Clostridium magnum DSM 2767]SHI20452.1 integrase/recombinase XerD [Clostridium magnum DSM 2767]